MDMKEEKISEIFFNCVNPSDPHRCSVCSLETPLLIHLRHHSTTTPTFNTAPKEYKCRKCTFSSFSKLLHIKHQYFDQSCQIYRCKLCPFKSKFQNNNLKRHILFKHANPNEIDWFQCDKCQFKTKYKHYLCTHQRVQHEVAEGEDCWFYCEQCSFKTKYKNNLGKHFKIKHRNDVRIYVCGKCDFKTKYKVCLIRHEQTKHREGAKKGGGVVLKHVPYFRCVKCSFCSYNTRDRTAMKEHQNVAHEGVGNFWWYQCDHCNFKSMVKLDSD